VQSDMGDLPANATAILTEVAGLAAARCRLDERAEALLAQVQRVVPFEAGTIALLPPGQRVHVTMSRHGFDDRTNAYYDGPGFLQDVELAGLQRAPCARRLVDLDLPPAEIPVWGEYLLPAGFREGLGVGLFTPDRRYMGLLGVVTERATPMTREAANLIGLLAPHIAAALDPLQLLTTMGGLVHEALAGIVLNRDGTALPLPGLPDHCLLAPGSRVPAEAASQLADGSVHVSFLVPDPGGAGAGAQLRVTCLAVPPDLRSFATAIVLLSPAGDLRGLSPRELQVLGVLVTGASNERIAATLGISVRTAAVHLDHARAKLAASSRTTAAALALRLGLFVPPSLLPDRRGPRPPRRAPMPGDRPRDTEVRATTMRR
jgi:DNA-binding CsgD family transcriptional regulator